MRYGDVEAGARLVSQETSERVLKVADVTVAKGVYQAGCAIGETVQEKVGRREKPY